MRLGIVTEQQFLNSLSAVLLDWCQRTGLYKHIYTQRLLAGEAEYTVPEDVIEPDLCFIGGRIIEQVAEEELDQSHADWRRQAGVPVQWHSDNLPPKKIELFPKPNYNGLEGQVGYGDFFAAGRNLTMVGAAAPSKTAWTLADTLDTIPDIFVHYLIYGVLEQIFSAEGESRDAQRALYCGTRYQEGVELARMLVAEEVEA